MKVMLKYGLFPVAVFVLLALLTAVLAPVLINVQRFVPRLEAEISEATGRRFSLGHDLSLSFFPWLSLTFSDMQLGNPSGFSGDYLLQVRSFEARIKVWPLLRSKVEVSRFVVGGLSVNLERRADGRGNWQDLLDAGEGSISSPGREFLAALLGNLSCSIVAVTDGQLRWRDATDGSEHRVEDIMLLFNDFTPHTAVSVDAKATIDGQGLAAEGKVGPLLGGREGKVAVDLGIVVGDALEGRLRGTLSGEDKDPILLGTYDVPAFDPGDLVVFRTLFPPLAEEGGEALGSLSFKGSLRLDRDRMLLEDGSGSFGDITFTYTLGMERGASRYAFILDVDHLDLDRYLPMLLGTSGEQSQAVAPLQAGRFAAMLSGRVGIGRLGYGGVMLEEVNLPMVIEDGRLVVSGASGTLAGGTLAADLAWSPGDQPPQVTARLTLRQADSAALLRQWLDKEGIRGLFAVDLDLQWTPAVTVSALEQLRGEGTLTLGEGVFLGIDLSKPVSASATAEVESSEDQVATPFSAGQATMALDRGVVELREASFALANGELRLSGAVDLLQRRLELETATSTVATVVDKRGRKEQVLNTSFHSIIGPIAAPEISDRLDLAATEDNSRQRAMLLLAEKLSPPSEEGLGDLVGKDLVDPAVVAERFGLQRKILQPIEMKRKYSMGTGRIRLGELFQEETLR